MLPPLLQAFFDDDVRLEEAAHEPVGPDAFPLLTASEWAAEHQLISELLEGVAPSAGAKYHLSSQPAGKRMLESDEQMRTRYYLALIERTVAHELELAGDQDGGYRFNSFFGYGAVTACLCTLLEAGVALADVIEPTLRWITLHRGIHYLIALGEDIVERLPSKLTTQQLDLLVALRGVTLDGDGRYLGRLPELLEQRLPADGLWRVLIPGDAWTDRAISQLQDLDEARCANWVSLLAHCGKATSAKPSAKWKKSAASLTAAIPFEERKALLLEWFALADRPKTHPCLDALWESVDERQRLHDYNATVLRGLVWLCAEDNDGELTRAMTRLALSCYRKVKGIGPRCVKVANATIFVLGELANTDAVAQLAVLKVRVKSGTAQKGIAKALAAAAERAGVSPTELEEMAVPAYGLGPVGMLEERLGQHTARIDVEPTGATLTFSDATGKLLKGVPAAVKKGYAEELKELKQAQKDIDKMLPAQAARIEDAYLQRRKWPFAAWKERYGDHPLVGTLCRRLIWRFTSGGTSRSAIHWDGTMQTVDGHSVPNIEACDVELWHPLDEEPAMIESWRSWLIEQQVTQPFKQAHREIYLLTDAERQTGTYSNRFAAHVLRQYQFNALAAARGWKSQLRMMVDDTYPPPSKHLSAWQLRAEYWVEGVGTEYGVDTSESGAYLHLATDQVRFYRLGAAENYAHAGGGGYGSSGGDVDENHPLALTEIPKLVFSEVMRDVDLFVGVASLGNDPTWSDGGPQGRYRDYWQNYSFGELNATAKTRRELLETLIPKLKIAERCRLQERFLEVRGDIRSYKIHLGSGNILMEPTDEYLCIVPKQSAQPKGHVFLPFQGDSTLSVILSKAMMLAADTKIKDQSIVSQIQR